MNENRNDEAGQVRYWRCRAGQVRCATISIVIAVAIRDIFPCPESRGSDSGRKTTPERKKAASLA